MTRAGQVRLAFATLLVRLAVALLAVGCGGLGHLHPSGPASVAVTWVSAWIRRDVAAMCRAETARARGGGPGTCRTRPIGITSTSDLPWTYGHPGRSRSAGLPAGVMVRVSAPDTGIGGQGFDWALLVRHDHAGLWRVTGYRLVTGPGRPAGLLLWRHA